MILLYTLSRSDFVKEKETIKITRTIETKMIRKGTINVTYNPQQPSLTSNCKIATNRVQTLKCKI
jgi:hypothetical protein